jgi:hypothetical protein
LTTSPYLRQQSQKYGIFHLSVYPAGFRPGFALCHQVFNANVVVMVATDVEPLVCRYPADRKLGFQFA